MSALTKTEAELRLMKQELEDVARDTSLTMEEKVKVNKMIKIIDYTQTQTEKISTSSQKDKEKVKEAMEKQAIDFVLAEFYKALSVKMETTDIIKKLEVFSSKSNEKEFFIRDFKGYPLKVRMDKKIISKSGKEQAKEQADKLFDFFKKHEEQKRKSEDHLEFDLMAEVIEKREEEIAALANEEVDAEYELDYFRSYSPEDEKKEEYVEKEIEEVYTDKNGIEKIRKGNEIIRKQILSEKGYKEIKIERKTEEEKQQMLFYQPIIEEIKNESKKVNAAREKAKELKMPIVIKPYNFIIQGEIGLGKSELSKQIHTQINYGKRMKNVTSAQMMSKYVGQSAETVRKVVEEVSESGGTLVVSSFESWLNHKGDNGTDHGLEPMKELVHLAKTKNFTLIFEGTAAEIQGLFVRMPEMKDLFYKTIELAAYKAEHMIELTEFKLKQNGFKITEEAKDSLNDYYKENKAKNGHFVAKTVQQLVVDILMNNGDLIVNEEDVKKLAKLNIEPEQSETKKSFEEAMQELEALIGQIKMKETVKKIINLAIIQKERKEKGKKEIKTTRHMVFSGSPGTGKTTVARIIGKLYGSAGILSKGHFVEVTIDQLTNASNVTENVNRLVDKALGGVLFIDEAYILLKTIKGREALDALIPLLENKREEFVCILAGYKKDMDELKTANVGLSSRTKEIIFEDYNAEELQQILENILKDNEYKIEEDAKAELELFIKENQFEGNGRAMRNLFDTIIETQANRLITEDYSEEDLEKISSKDIELLKI